eukprot:10678776-Karenia_brevis.AAC.1
MNLERKLTTGLRGIIQTIDDDGDFQVYFPSLKQEATGKHWLASDIHGHVELHRTIYVGLDGIWVSDKHEHIVVEQ